MAGVEPGGRRVAVPNDAGEPLRTSGRDVPLHAYRLAVGGRAWTILHTGAVLSRGDEARVIGELKERLPYGVALWPSAIALAHEILSRAGDFAGTTVLELGAGTGLPGIVAASLGGRVVQTDRNELALTICRRNGEQNGVTSVEHRLADWKTWGIAERFEWILGADILYATSRHAELRRIFESNLAPRGRILLADPFRAVSLPLLEEMEGDGWGVALSKWTVGDAEKRPRPVGVFELTPPR